MADNGQIDNLYFNVEVGGNAADEFDKIDKALENIEDGVNDVENAFESFANISKIDVLNKKLDNVNKNLDEAVSKNKDLEDKGVLNDLTKRFSLVDKLAKETAKTKPISEADYQAAEDAIKKVSTEVGRLEETLRVSKQRLAELASQGKENTTQFVNLASKIAKVEEKLLELKAASLPDLVDDKTTPTSVSGGAIDAVGAKVAPQMSRFRKILNSISNLFSKLGKDGDKAFKKIDKSTKKANNSSKNYNKGLRGLLATAKRFLIFGTFFTIQRQISQAFKDGTTNLYQYSKAIDGTFAQSMDRLSTSFLYLKNAIGAAVAPIINAVTPALESLIDTVAEFGNKLAETFAALTGATTFKKAIKSHKEYAEAVNATNNALAKFDEINNITTSKGDKNQDYGSMFETAQVGMKISNFGVAIGNTLNGIIGGINRKLESVDFRKLAKKLTTGLTDMVKTIDFGAVGELFTTLVLGVFDFADEVVIWLTNGDLQRTIFGALTELINGIGWEELFETITEFILATITRISNFTADTDAWSKLLSAVWKALLGILKGVGKGIWNWLNKTSIWDMIKQVWFLTNPMGATIGNLLFSKIEEGLGEGWQKIKNWLKNHTLVDLIKSIWGGVTDWFGSVFDVSPKNTKKIQGYASGGYVTSGDIFITRENGIPEMVGSIGGRTAVANNDQIVEAISIGVYNAYMDAMSRSGGNKQPTIVQINGREVFRAVQDESTAYSRRTGQPAF